MKRLMSIALLAGLLASAAAGQPFNVDIGGTTGAGAGAPSATFGGAANKPGTWNDITGTTTGPFALVDLSGAPSAVSVTRNNGTGGGFNANNTMTSGDFELLMDDGQDCGGAGGTRTYTVTGLAAGTYTVYTYAWAPDSAAFFTSVTVTGATGGAVTVGGTLTAADTFGLGITHSVHVVTVAAGATLDITGTTSAGFGTLNGFQICNDYALTLSQPGGSGTDLIVRNTCGQPGNSYVNLFTFNNVSFPAGPVFGLDMTIADALFLVGFGPPFFGTLDAEGQFSVTLPAPIPTGITIYLVSLQLTPTGGLVSIGTPFAYTTT